MKQELIEAAWERLTASLSGESTATVYGGYANYSLNCPRDVATVRKVLDDHAALHDRTPLTDEWLDKNLPDDMTYECAGDSTYEIWKLYDIRACRFIVRTRAAVRMLLRIQELEHQQ